MLTFETGPFTSANVIDLAGIPRFSVRVTGIHQLPAGEPGLVAAFQLDPKV